MPSDFPTYAQAASALALGIVVLTAVLALGARPGGGAGGEPGWGGRLEALLHPIWRSAAPGGGPSLGRGAGLPAALLCSGGGLVLGLALFRGLVPALLFAGLAGGLAAARVRSGRQALTAGLRAGLESALEALVASLKAGRVLLEALDAAASQASPPFREALAEALAAHRAGVELGEAVAGLGRDRPLPEAAYLGACLKVHARTGGDVTALLLNLGGVLRERGHLARELAARTNEARATATLLSLLAPGLLAYILWVEPGQILSLVATPFGAAAAAYAAVSWLAGVLVTRRMLQDLTRDIDG